MFRIFFPIFIIIISIFGLYFFVSPLYKQVSILKKDIASYDVALDNSKRLEKERDRLVAKYNAISTENLDKLNKLLPDSVDSIRLILEIEKIAAPYGMVLKDTRYESTSEKDKTNASSNLAGSVSKNNKNYGVWDLEFSTEGKYSDFLKLLSDLENNLRIVDISSIGFTSEQSSSKIKDNISEDYKYNFKIKTYWLKN